MCTGPSNGGRPSASGRKARPAMGIWIARTKPIALRRLSKTRRPVRIVATMSPKSSSSSTTAAASRATSVPRWPMAMPICAAFSAGASFTPSPVIATTSPAAFSASTMRSFCSGRTRAKTAISCTRTRNAASSSAAISAPVATGASSRPALRAMAAAVAGWSPVIMAMRMPALRQSRTASGTDGRSGSARATRPRKPSAASASPPLRGTPGPQRASASPRTRSPRPAISAAAASAASAAAGGKLQRRTTASGAPFTAIIVSPPGRDQARPMAGRPASSG